MQRDEILQKIRERMVAFATSRLSRDVAEDLAQEVLIVIQEKYQDTKDLSELLPLSFQIMRYKMLDLHRKTFRRGEYNPASIEEFPLADPADSPETRTARKQAVDRLLHAIQQLGERCRNLFRLKLQGKSFPEIQIQLKQRSINTIYTWDSRCRKQLLDALGGRWDSL